MKKLLSAIGLLVAFGAHAGDDTALEKKQEPTDKKEEINYGDPTAIFKSFGVLHNLDGGVQANIIYGHGKNYFQVDLTSQYKDQKGKEGTKGFNYRARYFYVDEGLGFSGDIIGTHNQNTNSTMALGGIIYKINVTENFMVFPMLAAGYSHAKSKHSNEESSTPVVQPGLYAMYAFDGGHWLYANPKMTHEFRDPRNADYQKYDKNQWEVEFGGGYMLNDWSSLEVKVEHKWANKTRRPNASRLNKDDTVGWVKYAVFW
ncbi:hypothetical protein [Vibrio maritimus]|uniref:hypothetical protein n=1 Tax=Vibrio maritimus TaxID=990268 RepID=UPI001F3E7CCB|nr:hypothetical protein [Vibrio maritimus]